MIMTRAEAIEILDLQYNHVLPAHNTSGINWGTFAAEVLEMYPDRSDLADALWEGRS